LNFLFRTKIILILNFILVSNVFGCISSDKGLY